MNMEKSVLIKVLNISSLLLRNGKIKHVKIKLEIVLMLRYDSFSRLGLTYLLE